MKIYNLYGEELLEIDSNTLINTNLKGADLEYADLEYADLEYADLEGANLKNANLKNANLKNANLKGANLEGANLEGANLRVAKSNGIDIIYIQSKKRIIGKSEIWISKENVFIGCAKFDKKTILDKEYWYSFDNDYSEKQIDKYIKMVIDLINILWVGWFDTKEVKNEN